MGMHETHDLRDVKERLSVPALTGTFGVLGLAEGHHVSDAAVQYVIDGCRKMLAQTAAHIQEVVKNKLSELEVDTSVIDHVHREIDDCFVDPFDGLGTSYLRDKYFKKRFHYLVSGSVLNPQDQDLLPYLSFILK